MENSWILLQDIYEKTIANFADSQFLAGELGSFVFVVVASALATLAIGKFINRPYTGWTLQIDGHESDRQHLYSEEVKSYLSSDFELWKMVKSVASGEYVVLLPTGMNAFGTWVHVDKKIRTIAIDLKQAQKLGHVEVKKTAPQSAIAAGKTIFVSRHPGAKEWATSEGHKFDLQVDHFDLKTVNRGDRVWGTLPIHLAAAICELGAIYCHLALDVPKGHRGQEFTYKEMKQFNARLERYIVSRPS